MNPSNRGPDRSGLELDPEKAERRKLAELAMRLLDQMQERRDGEPMFVPTPPDAIDTMLQPPPEEGAALVEVMSMLQAVSRLGWSKLQGGDLAYIPSGGLYTGAIAALLASGLHPFTGSACESPALIALEESVLRWLAATMGLPHTTEGVLLSGGSLANQTAIAVARDERGGREAAGVAYIGERVHHSLVKAFGLCGVPGESVRTIPALPDTRIDVTALRAQMERDRAAGRKPWLVVGVAGGTDLGAIDDLPALARLAADAGAWFHVDAAYGGMFRLTERGRERLAGLEAADSITVDAHKGMALPYGVAALLVREAGALGRTHAGHGAYMRDVPLSSDLPHYFERGPELTRPFRGLLVWLPLQLHGVARFRQMLDRSLDLARSAARQLESIAQLEVLQPPTLSIVAFRARAGDAATESIIDAINRSGRLRVSSTSIGGHTAIRLAFLHPRTGRPELDYVIDIVRQAAGAIR
jgi:aromatic-L-amino-acid/L-tryptophan decarboxylase